jgi:hypothetical protein
MLLLEQEYKSMVDLTILKHFVVVCIEWAGYEESILWTQPYPL